MTRTHLRGLAVQTLARTFLVALALSAAGCGSGSSATSGSSTSASADTGGPVRVVMKVLEFSPATVTAMVGQTVIWRNEDTSPHNVTYVSGPRFRSSRRMPPGATFTVRLTQAGTIRYFCTIHPWMKAEIVVSR